MKSRILLVSTLSTLAAANVGAAGLDFEDCNVLTGQSQRQEFEAFVAAQRSKAGKGDLPARKTLAAIANNRFACYLDSLQDGAGWSVIQDSGKKSAVAEVTTMSTRVVDAAVIMNSPKALDALRGAFAEMQSLADDDVAYRNMAAGYVADYAPALPGKEGVAYRDAVGVREVACRFPEVLRGNSGKTFCLSAKSAIASLYEKLSPAERSRQEAAGERWAERFVESAKR